MSPVLPFIAGAPSWLDSPGGHDGIVLSSRVRLARNRAGTAFRRMLDADAQARLVEDLLAIIGDALGWPAANLLRPSRLADAERLALCERHLISRELAAAGHASGLAISPERDAALLVNEEDHLRLQAFAPGLALDRCLERAVAIDRALEDAAGWAVHPAYGYLTACHTNMGTGLRASAMLHLPALTATGEIKAVLRALEKLHLAVRGLHGEGSEPTGHCFQISNARTLGEDEDAIVAGVHAAVLRLVEAERLARGALLAGGRAALEDKVFRAWGLLTHARQLASEEIAEPLSWLRLGLAMRLLPGPAPSWAALDRIFLACQPAHLQLTQPGADDAAGSDRIRAALIRQWLGDAAERS